MKELETDKLLVLKMKCTSCGRVMKMGMFEREGNKRHTWCSGEMKATIWVRVFEDEQ